MDRTDEAFEDGISDGSETFIEALINYAAGPSPVTPELRVKLQEFVATVVAATMSAGVGTSDPFVSEAEYGRACGANFTSSGSPSNTSGCTFLVTGRPMSISGIRFWWDGAGSRTVRCSLWDGVGNFLVANGEVACSAAGIYTLSFPSPVEISSFREYRVSKIDLSAPHRWFATNANVSAQTSALMTAASFFGQPAGQGWRRTGGCVSTADGDTFPDADDSTAIYFVDPVLV